MIIYRSRFVISYFIAKSRNIRYLLELMTEDNELKSTLREIIYYATRRIETTSDANTKQCLFKEYKE